jgi:hypothetical protein
VGVKGARADMTLPERLEPIGSKAAGK